MGGHGSKGSLAWVVCASGILVFSVRQDGYARWGGGERVLGVGLGFTLRRLQISPQKAFLLLRVHVSLKELEPEYSLGKTVYTFDET
jgi:hypothetical protein